LHGFRNSGQGTLHLHAVLASPVFEATPEGETEPVRRWVKSFASAEGESLGSDGSPMNAA
jgi:hypothetical protein